MVVGASIETLLSLYSLHESGVFKGDFYVFVITEAVLCLPTVLGNLLILISIFCFPVLKNTTSILIANLALADFLVGAILIPVDLASMLHPDFANERWFCLMETSLYVAFLATSVVNIFIISLERWCAIVFPFWYNAHVRSKFLNIIIVTVWITMSVVAALPLLGYNTHVDGKTPCNTDFIWMFEYKILITTITVACLLASTILYIWVVYNAYVQRKRTRAIPLFKWNIRLKRHVKRTRLMMYVLGLFILCWSPFTVLTIIFCFYQSQPLARARKFSVLLGLLNSALNWIVYGLLNSKFRSAFKTIIKCSCRVRVSRQNSSNMMPSIQVIALNPLHHP